MKLLVALASSCAHCGLGWKVSNRDRALHDYTSTQAPACRAGAVVQNDWDCNEAELKVLSQAVPCSSKSAEGEAVATCVDNIDVCANLAAADPECERLIRYFGNATGPAGYFAGLCGCVKKDLGCTGWPEKESTLARVTCKKANATEPNNQTANGQVSQQPVALAAADPSHLVWEDVDFKAPTKLPAQRLQALKVESAESVHGSKINVQVDEEGFSTAYIQLRKEHEALKDRYEQAEKEINVVRQGLMDYQARLEERESPENRINGSLSLGLTAGSRSLAFRSSCKNCFCLVQDAVHCGADTVQSAALCGASYITDAAKCGKDYITDAAKCGMNILKSCGWRRRRKLGELRCNFAEAAKKCDWPRSCHWPNTCQWPKSCDLKQSFGECLSSITSATNLDEEGKKILKVIINSGCSTPTGCKAQIELGLAGLTDLLREALEPQLKSIIQKMMGGTTELIADMNKYVQVVQSGSQQMISTARENIESAAGTVKEFFSGVLPTFQKYNLGSVCTPTGVGFWSMTGSDCGTFDEMGQIFTDITNAGVHFERTASNLKTCITKKGLLGFPTPFMNLKIEQFCLPRYLVIGLEYVLGGVIYGGSLLANLFTKITSTISDFVTSKLGMMQMGQTLSRSSEYSNSTVAGPKCSGKPNWGMDLLIRLTINLKLAGELNVGFSLGMGIGIGCVGGFLANPNGLLQLGFAYGWALGEIGGAGIENGIEFGLSWYDTMTSYASQRWSVGSYLTVSPSFNLEVGPGSFVSANLPVSLLILPDPAVPTGFTFVIRGSAEQKAGMIQLGKETSKAASEAVEAMPEAHPSTQTLAAITAAAERLASPEGLESVLAKAAPDRDQILKQASYIQENQQRIAEEAQAARTAPGFGLSVTSDLAFSVCINPGKCT